MYPTDNWFLDRRRAATAKALSQNRRHLQDAPLVVARATVMQTVRTCFADVSDRDQRIAHVISQSADWCPAICDWIYFRWDSECELLRPIASFNSAELVIAIGRFHADLGVFDKHLQGLFAHLMRSAATSFGFFDEVTFNAARPVLGVDQLDRSSRPQSVAGALTWRNSATTLVNCIETVRNEFRRAQTVLTRREETGARQYSWTQSRAAKRSAENLISTVFPPLRTALGYWREIDEARLDPNADQFPDPDGTRFLLRAMLNNQAALSPLFCRAH